jgi:hypothetical protein
MCITLHTPSAYMHMCVFKRTCVCAFLSLTLSLCAFESTCLFHGKGGEETRRRNEHGRADGRCGCPGGACDPCGNLPLQQRHRG